MMPSFWMTSSTVIRFRLVWLLEIVPWPNAGETMRTDTKIARRRVMFPSDFPERMDKQ